MTSTVLPFELAVYCEVFGIDRTGRGVPAFDFAICSEHPGVPVPTSGGLHVTPTEGLRRLAAADLVAVAPPVAPAREVSPEVSAALHAAVDRGARVVAVCTAGFLLASAGLLDSRTIAAHWLHAEQMREWFPKVTVDPSVLYVDDDPFFTSAGTAAGIDLCLHLIRKDHGSAAAEAVARGMVLGPQRAAHQTPPPPLPAGRPDDGIDKLLDWALGNLHEDLSIDILARRAFLSTRSFSRRFRAATGTTPYAWVLEQRVRLAQQLLETDPRVGVEEAAGRAGFSSAALLRQHFQRRFGCSPSEYRARFVPSSP